MEALDLSNISDRTWNIQACSAVSQQGLNEGMEWLIRNIKDKAAGAGAGAGVGASAGTGAGANAGANAEAGVQENPSAAGQ